MSEVSNPTPPPGFPSLFCVANSGAPTLLRWNKVINSEVAAYPNENSEMCGSNRLSPAVAATAANAQRQTVADCTGWMRPSG